MPILPAEPDRYPADLFDVAAGVGRAWYVLHTRPRQEKALARRLHAAGAPHYLPAVRRRCRIRNRVINAYVPLFPGYLFLLADARERHAALATDRVLHALEVFDQGRLAEDLRQIDRLLGAGVAVATESRPAPGTRVEITTGPLAGLCGTVVRTDSGRRFVVRVDFIQQGASVLLEDCALLPLRREAVATP
jgi:transcription antitermination factor NusG